MGKADFSLSEQLPAQALTPAVAKPRGLPGQPPGSAWSPSGLGPFTPRSSPRANRARAAADIIGSAGLEQRGSLFAAAKVSNVRADGNQPLLCPPPAPRSAGPAPSPARRCLSSLGSAACGGCRRTKAASCSPRAGPSLPAPAAKRQLQQNGLDPPFPPLPAAATGPRPPPPPRPPQGHAGFVDAPLVRWSPSWGISVPRGILRAPWLSNSRGCFGLRRSSRLLTHVGRSEGSGETELLRGSYESLPHSDPPKATKLLPQPLATPSDRHPSLQDSCQAPARLGGWHAAPTAGFHPPPTEPEPRLRLPGAL